jgi:hypothetical protein
VTLSEGDLEMDVPDALGGGRFDGAAHGLGRCMKAVDFVLELADRYLYIELKDPQHPRATDRARNAFIEELRSGRLDQELKYKYRDSFLYEWAAGRADKPVHYLVLIAVEALDDAQLASRTHALVQQLPLRGPQGPGRRPWVRPIVHFCGVFNIASWNRNFPKHPVRRVATPVREG